MSTGVKQMVTKQATKDAAAAAKEQAAASSDGDWWKYDDVRLKF